MMTVANRLRGTYGWFAKVFGVTVVIAVYLLTDNVAVALLIGGGYWLGELWCGWGDHVGNTTCERYVVFPYFPEDGSNTGVRWLTSMLVYPQLWRLHLANAKIGLYNWYPKVLNAGIKNYSIAKLLGVVVEQKQITPFTIDKALRYSRVYLVIRGLVWWILPMFGVGLLGSWTAGIVGLLVLSLGWSVCAELGYIYRDKIAISKFGLSFIGGWELQEGFVGILQDLVLICVVIAL